MLQPINSELERTAELAGKWKSGGQGEIIYLNSKMEKKPTDLIHILAKMDTKNWVKSV